ncbi:hypothetical protein Tsubulata_047060, partial [Turnera subulata]
MDSGFIVTHLLYKAALVLALLRWAVSWALSFKNRTRVAPPTPPSSNNDSLHKPHPVPSSQEIKDRLISTTYGDITDRVAVVCDTCAVCLSHLKEDDE